MCYMLWCWGKLQARTCRMIGTIINILKGGWNARKPENSVPGGDGCEHRIIYPFEAICEQAISDIGRVRMLAAGEQAISDIGRVRMLAAACAAERSGDSGAVSSDPIRREGLALIAAARRTGYFHHGGLSPLYLGYCHLNVLEGSVK